jgi:hypothetical protein
MEAEIAKSNAASGNGKTLGGFSPPRIEVILRFRVLPERGRSSVVERQLPKLYVEGSIPFARSSFFK